MIDLKKANLPKAVEVDGRFYRVHTSFKYWLRFLELIEDRNTPPTDFDFMYIDDKPQSRLNGVMALIQFCNPPQVLPRAESFNADAGDRVTDYNLDSDFIYAAFMELYGVDLVESNMHWHKFLALFKGIHGTKLNEIISYRLYENTSGKRDSYTRQMEKLRRAWELPRREDEHDEALAAFEAKLHK